MDEIATELDKSPVCERIQKIYELLTESLKNNISIKPGLIITNIF